MSARRTAARMLVALCLLSAPAAALGQEQAVAQPSNTSATTHRPNRVLTRVIIFGSIGAIAGALGSLRKRSGIDTLGGEDDR